MTGTDLTSAVDSGNRGPIEITLRIWHPTEDPHRISQAMQLNPALSYKAGEPRVTPKGKPLSSVHRETLWSYDLAVDSDSSLADAIEAMDLLLASREEQLERLRLQGSRIEYFVGLFLEGDRTELLPSSLMSRCGEKGIDLVLSVYAPRDDVADGR